MMALVSMQASLCTPSCTRQHSHLKALLWTCTCKRLYVQQTCTGHDDLVCAWRAHVTYTITEGPCSIDDLPGIYILLPATHVVFDTGAYHQTLRILEHHQTTQALLLLCRESQGATGLGSMCG